MKNEKGITLVTLSVYIIGITIIIAIVALITNFFNKNIMDMEDNARFAADFSKFNLAFVDEVKTYGNEITECSESSVSFSTGNTYKFEDGKIYKNKIALVNNVNACSFSRGYHEAKQTITVYIEIGSGANSFAKTTEYVLNYEEPNNVSLGEEKEVEQGD